MCTSFRVPFAEPDQWQIWRGSQLQVYEALNALGAVPWKVNRQVLQTVSAAWAAGGIVAKLPDRRLAESKLEELHIPRFFQAVRVKHQLQFKVCGLQRSAG